MNENRIYLCLAHMSEAGMEMKYIQEAFDTNWVVPLGPNVNAFEEALEDFVSQKADHAKTALKRVAALSSGTAAIHLALIACGVKQGDEVMVQSFTFGASANPVTYLGATPVFVDSEPDTWNMDPELLARGIRERMEKTGRRPKAIIPVHLYGMPAKMDDIMAVARQYEIPVIEDAAEAFGSTYHGRKCGTLGDYGILSFNGNKMITTSGGGALICPSAEARERIVKYATQAREAFPYYQHEEIGYNYRMSNICAGIGRGQMTVAAAHIAHHRHVHQLYEQLFADVAGITVHSQPDGIVESTGSVERIYNSNYWLSTILLDEQLKVKGEEKAYDGMRHTDCEPNRPVDALRLALDEAGIESRPLWKPMHRQPVYRNAPAFVNGVSEGLFKRGLCLPSGPYVTDDDVERIVNTIKKQLL